jgi:pilus assembly protein CpaB
MQAEKKVAETQQNQVPVLVANQDIPQGARIDSDMFEVMTAPSQNVPPQVASSLSQVVGKTAGVPIARGEPIMLNNLTAARQTQATSLATATPIGKRAITIPVDNISSVGGMIKPGNYVDIICTIPTPVQTQEGKQTTQDVILPLFQNVLVLAVGEKLSAEEMDMRTKEKESSVVAPIITLALSPNEANIIAFVQEQGKIRLILRSPADAQIQAVQPISWDTLFQYFVPPEERGKQTIRQEKPQELIEIYRGLNREMVPLSK